jgi:putative pyruvate formate lyase activating enzyme
MAEWPAYLGLWRSGELAERVAAATELLRECRLCPRECAVDRLAGERGFCRAGRLARVCGAEPHFGEERPLVGRGGSGTVFFSYCNLGCRFCQNWDIAHQGIGREATASGLAAMMLELQARGCHNINLVTPTHYLPQILEAVALAVADGLRLPLVWNCGGYESVEALQLLDGIMDIYMPDAKFADGAVAERLARAADYPERMRAALTEMHHQVGDLQLDAEGIATRGLLVRHLVLPEGQAGTREIAKFLHSLSPQTYINVMAQYRPQYKATLDPLIGRALTRGEYREAVAIVLEEGLSRLDEGPRSPLPDGT